MSRRKHIFHCQRCHSSCTIYKKGKGHRVLVCPHCGVIATNPSAKGALEGAAAGAAIGSVVPVLGTGVGAALGGAVGYFSGDGSPSKRKSQAQPNYAPSHPHLTSFEKALLLESIEHKIRHSG